MSTTELHHGDCLNVLRRMQSACVDAIVTDPPYGLSFMGRKWDYDVPSTEIWEQCLRVLKPGGHLLAFAGTRTQHRMCVNIEDAGFEIRDMIAWVYGSGFPKSQNVGKAIDKAANSERKVLGVAGKTGSGRSCMNDAPGNGRAKDYLAGEYFHSAPATPEAQQWDGWGTALKPALEPITVARKPFKGTVANNVLEYGTGAINIDGCRVGSEVLPAQTAGQAQIGTFERGVMVTPERVGRWPANLIHDGSDEVTQPLNDSARFFYTAKASKDDRDKGNTHPTVKPTDLMAYLCRLVTPPGGTVLDPFMGSGTTGKAALSEGFSFVGIERDAEYYAICESRFNGAQIGLALAV
jgi:DNA modification methylase